MEGTSEIIFVYFISTALLTILVISIILVAVFYQNHLVKIRRKETENLLKTALGSEKNERTRIAKDIHDSIQGDLNSIRNFIVTASKNEDTKRKNELLSLAEESLENTLLNTRNIVHKLMPPLLESRGFETALEDYLDKLKISTSISMSFHSEIREMLVPKEHAYELFRVVQEWIQNIMKHSNATKIDVSLKSLEKKIQMTIQDDGQPFDFKESVLKSKGSGLSNIKSRLQVIQAEMTQHSIQEGNVFIIQFYKL